MFFVYAIWNNARDKIYIGHTQNLEVRLRRHNGLLAHNKKSFTSKNNGEWQLVYEENFVTRNEAMIREKQLKSARGRIFVRDIIKHKFKN